MLSRCLVVALGIALAMIPVLGSADEAGLEFFEKQVRPILAARCYECHSGKIAEAKGSLRVDSRGGLLKGGDTGPAIVPGKPGESLLVDAINHGDLYQMPPKTKLPAEEIAALTKWVELGAPWPEEETTAPIRGGSGFDLAQRKAEHWCWQPITQPEVPSLRTPHSALRNPIDAFILAKLEGAGLSPAPPADKRTLLRRVYSDLTGLPPTPEELAAFLDDDSPRAFERVVDRLLDSPHFGERWGRHWLDLVRYAESRGHEFDYNVPNAFEYRDYVIRALNADLPYDQFVIEHVAGDLLPEPRLHPSERYNESILATGFWFLGEAIHSPVDIRKDECDRVDNQIDVFSKTFLGLTVACARCHDHKFDAISQEDYYALAGYFYSSSYRLTRFETWEQDRQIAAELARLHEEYRPQFVAAAVKSLQPRIEELAQKLAKEIGTLQTELGVDEVDLRGAKTIVDYAALPAEHWMAEGPTFGTATMRLGEVVLNPDAAMPLEVATYGAARRDQAWGDLEHAATSEGDQGRLGGWLRAGRALKTPTWTLASGKVHYLIEGAGHVYAAVDSHALINGPLHSELAKDTGGDSDLPMRWITHDLSRYVGHRVHLEFSPKEGEDFRVLMVVEGNERPAAPKRRANALLERVAAGGQAGPSTQEILTTTLDLLAKEQVAADETGGDRAAIANWLLQQVDAADAPEFPELVHRFREDHAAVTARIKRDARLCLAMWQGTPVDEYLLIRGNHKTVGPVVPRRTLAALEELQPGSPGSEVRGAAFQPAANDVASNGRLALARKLVDPTNPLVSRVMVNRVWHHLFGRGIVPSTDNFGVLGQEPTHPELLDYLATQLMEEGWSVKRLIRSIVLSETYRQGSAVRSQGSDVDPQNLLFHRQNLKRLEGEAIRDAILAVSGRLDRTMYGPSVPVHLTPFMQGRGRPSTSGPLDGNGRRSLYIAVRRNFLPPMMLAFDTPAPSSTVGRRNASNVPAQALILMNDPFVIEQSQLWARKMLTDKNAAVADRVRQMYLQAFSREPTGEETAAAISFLDQQAGEYGLSAEAAGADERVWADLGHVLFNVKEFVFLN